MSKPDPVILERYNLLARFPGLTWSSPRSDDEVQADIAGVFVLYVRDCRFAGASPEVGVRLGRWPYLDADTDRMRAPVRMEHVGGAGAAHRERLVHDALDLVRDHLAGLRADLGGAIGRPGEPVPASRLLGGGA